MGLIRDIGASHRKNWTDALYETSFALVFGLLPVWGTALLFTTLARIWRWDDFILHGEFAVYSAALVGPSIHQLWQLKSKPGAPGRGFLLVALVQILVATLVFAATVMGAQAPAYWRVDRDFMASVSLIELIGAIVFVYIVQVLENIYTSADPAGESTREVDELEREVRSLSE